MRKDILNESRVDYGKQIVKNPLDKLTVEYGRGWSKNQLQHCLRTAEVFYKRIRLANRREEKDYE